MHCGERKIPLRWMYATNFFLLLPADGGRGLLDAMNKVSRRFFFERRDDLRASDVLRRMVATRMKDAARRWAGG